MKVRFQLPYRTAWGERLQLRIGAERLDMHYAEAGWWVEWEGSVEQPTPYCYQVVCEHFIARREWGMHTLPVTTAERCLRYDAWLDTPAESAFYTSAFTQGIFARHERAAAPTLTADDGLLVWEVEAPTVASDEVVAIVGEAASLGNWNPDRALRMSDADYPTWRIAMPSAGFRQGMAFKFVVLDAATGRLRRWEGGENRLWSAPMPATGEVATFGGLRLRDEATPWRGAGVAIPLFSIRSAESAGVGDFYDLQRLVDWAERTRQRIIQILPINDTTMSHTWQDSYPYNANSIFALHPQYLRPEAAGVLRDKAEMARFRSEWQRLNVLEEVDYEAVNRSKRNYLHRLFAEQGEATAAQADYQAFVTRNRTWLLPYAAYCTLRDRYGTADFRRWEAWATYDAAQVEEALTTDEAFARAVAEVYFVQYHLDKQLRAARNYAHAHGVVLKGDIPIGVSRTSVDAWTDPCLFHLDCQAGAPPDDFSVLGQNWGFPTYNWAQMAQDGYAWWRARFRKMAEYFDAYRIDHILGFFRIWEIPVEAVHGLLGHFNPALPYTAEALRAAGLDFTVERYARPYLRRRDLEARFGSAAEEVIARYLTPTTEGYALRSEVATQRAIAEQLPGDAEATLREGLMSLLDEVLFVEDSRAGYYHPRIAAQSTASYRDLPAEERAAYDRLYNDFFYYRHNDFWQREAERKLPPLLAATEMLVCGEDLGMIPACVPTVMQEQQILSLEIQRMPKVSGCEFADVARYPYRAVATTSTHDMNPLRAWWEEQPEATQRFYRDVLHRTGQAPATCPPDIAEAIVAQHLASPAMWTILPLQDWLAIDGDLRRADPHAERINIPAISRHHWRYRMHLTVEELLAAEALNAHLAALIAAHGR